jgi:hypothetical protein
MSPMPADGISEVDGHTGGFESYRTICGQDHRVTWRAAVLQRLDVVAHHRRRHLEPAAGR